MTKINSQLISPPKEYPYLNRILKNLKGEIWKGIPGFDYYEISNLGRVKSLSRYREITIPSRGTITYWTKEMILKQGIVQSKNNYLGEDLVYLRTTLKQDGTYYQQIVSRLVYQVFINNGHPISAGIRIIHLDGDNLNNKVKNLFPSEQGNISRNSFANKRRESYFTDLSDLKRKEYADKIAEVNQIPVTQYDSSGKRLNIFSSINEAAQKTGANVTTISSMLNGRYKMAGGFIWVKGKGKAHIDMSALKEWLQNRHRHKCKCIAQYSLQGEVLAIYPSVKEAAKAVDGNARQLSDAMHGRSRTAYKFIWKSIIK